MPTRSFQCKICGWRWGTLYGAAECCGKLSPTEDLVNSPSHYTQGGIEAIDYIESSVADFKSYCHGNACKYLHRHAYKGKPVQDLEKAIYYINKLKEQYEIQRIPSEGSSDRATETSKRNGHGATTAARDRELPETD